MIIEGVTIGTVAIGTASIIVSVALSSIRSRKEIDRLWREVNENRKRINRINTYRKWERGSFDQVPVFDFRTGHNHNSTRSDVVAES